MAVMKICYAGTFVPIRRFNLGAANSDTLFAFMRADGRWDADVDVELPVMPPRQTTLVRTQDGDVLVAPQQLRCRRPVLVASLGQRTGGSR